AVAVERDRRAPGQSAEEQLLPTGGRVLECLLPTIQPARALDDTIGPLGDWKLIGQWNVRHIPHGREAEPACQYRPCRLPSGARLPRRCVMWQKLREEQPHRSQAQHEHALDAAPIEQLQTVHDAGQWLKKHGMLWPQPLWPGGEA